MFPPPPGRRLLTGRWGLGRGRGPAASDDKEPRVRSRKARAPPPPVCCPCSGQGAATQHRAPRRDGQRPQDRLRTKGARNAKGREPLHASRRVGEASTRQSAAGPRKPCSRAHSAPPPHVAVRVLPRARARRVRPPAPSPPRCPSSPSPARTGAGGAEGPPAEAPDGSPRCHLRWPRAGRRRGPGAQVAAASRTRAKTPPGRGSRAEEASGGAAIMPVPVL